MNNSSEDWGYKFTGKSIDSFIRNIEGDAALESYPEFHDRRNHAEQLMFDLFGQTPHLFYIRRIEQGYKRGEQKWELILATDLNNSALPIEIAKCQSTLKLIAIVNDDGASGLIIISAQLRPKREGKKDSFSTSFYLRLQPNYRYRIGVPFQTIKRMSDTPVKQDCIPTEKQLEAWKVFVKVEERIAKEKQFCVPFVSHNYGEATRNITFAIDAKSATVDNQAENSITLDDFWQRAKRARNQNIKLKNNNSSNSDEIELGTIESIDFKNGFLKISLDSEIFDLVAEGRYTLQQEGILSFEARGDLTQINRKKKALENLEKGKTKNPYLGQFLFDASQAREPREIIQIQSQDLLLKTINYSQKAAVETVLSAPDLALIQGPPGTGKTTVIAEICYQVALRGGRTLIASQANLAVDNALSRLHHNPVIRAVRKGNRNSVGLEGEPFLEDNVLKNWLQNTSADCEERLNEKLKIANILRQLLSLIANLKSKEQLYQRNKEFLESLQQTQKKYLDSQKKQQKNIDTIKNYHKRISLAQPELEKWSFNAHQEIHKILNTCLQKRLSFSDDLMNFPNQLQNLKTKFQEILPLHLNLHEYLIEFDNLIEEYCQWDKAYYLANKLDREIIDIFEKTTIDLPSEKAILQEIKTLKVCQLDRLDAISALDQLKKIAQLNIAEIKKPLKFWKRVIEAIFTIAYKLGWCSLSRRKRAVVTLEAVRRTVSQIVRASEPNKSSIVIQSITPNIINISINNTYKWLDDLNTKIQQRLRQAEKDLSRLEGRVKEVQLQISEAQEKLIAVHQDIKNHLNSVNELLQTIPESLKLKGGFSNSYQLNSLNNLQLQFEVWQQQLRETEAYLNRYENIISDWVEGLKNPSEQNRHELRRIYLDNANVIGITCSQSAKGDFSREFESFDVVIIDEVSKCTPPELLIPALKAKKLVLVGDHKQLPPMLNDDTIEEISEELGTTTEELKYLKESLFKNLFESAPRSIKKMLTIQYRMHPQIMGAINQFYEDNLECGLTNPDEQRSHHLANHNIQNNNHIVWIKTPQNREFSEKQDGTSSINEKEVKLIEKICQQFEQTWSVRVNQGEPRKEIGIITFYGRQLKLIESTINPKKFPSLHIRTGTVDSFQGMERQIIIVSMVRNNERRNVGFAKKSERVNVAFSRAQELLIIIGCHSLFTQLPVYSKVSDSVRLHGGLIDVSDIL